VGGTAVCPDPEAGNVPGRRGGGTVQQQLPINGGESLPTAPPPYSELGDYGDEPPPYSELEK